MLVLERALYGMYVCVGSQKRDSVVIVPFGRCEEESKETKKQEVEAALTL